MNNRTRPPAVTVIGWYAVVMGALRGAFVAYMLLSFNTLFRTVGKHPEFWGDFLLAALSNGGLFLAQTAAGIAILKGHNWGRFLFALAVPASAAINQIVHEPHLPKLGWWGQVWADVVFAVVLFLPVASGYFRSGPLEVNGDSQTALHERPTDDN